MSEMGSSDLVEKEAILHASPLVARLDRRRTHSTGVISLQRSVGGSANWPSWIAQRSTLLDQLQTRYSIQDTALGTGTDFPLAMASPVPAREAIQPSPAPVLPEETPPRMAAATLIPTSPVDSPSAPLQIQRHIFPDSSPLPTGEPDSVSTPISLPSAPLMHSTPAPVQPAIAEIPSLEGATRYRIRRVAAQPLTSDVTLQRQGEDTSTAPLSSLETGSSAPPPLARSQEAGDAGVGSQNSVPSDVVIPSNPNATSMSVPSNPSATSMSVPSNPIAPGQGDATLPPIVMRKPTLAPEQPIAKITLPPINSASDRAAIQPSSLSSTVLSSPPVVAAASLPPLVQRQEMTEGQPIPPSGSSPPSSPGSPVLADRAIALTMREIPVQPGIVWRKSGSGMGLGTGRVLQSHSQSLPLAFPVSRQPQPEMARQPEATGSSLLSSEGAPPRLPIVPIPVSSGSSINVGQIAEQVSRILHRQLTVERERRGRG